MAVAVYLKYFPLASSFSLRMMDRFTAVDFKSLEYECGIYFTNFGGWANYKRSLL